MVGSGFDSFNTSSKTKGLDKAARVWHHAQDYCLTTYPERASR